jgi:2-polyprenyl-3-methyl-5-hydroxy-6-metoxy-1,4-benzoquinol methylase
MSKLQQFGHPATYPKILSLLRLKPGSRILDVGAGSGYFSRELIRAGYAVHATDAPNGLVQFGAEEVPFSPCDLNAPGDLPFEPGSFDAVVCIEVVEHLENHYSLVRKCYRVLVPGGSFIITTPNILNLASRVKFLLAGSYPMFGYQYEMCHGGKYHRPQAHISPCSYWQLRHALHTNGFRIVRVATERLRRSSLFLAPLIPLIWWCTWRDALKDDKKFGAEQRPRKKELAKHMLSGAVLFGKSLIICAEKVSALNSTGQSGGGAF